MKNHLTIILAIVGMAAVKLDAEKKQELREFIGSMQYIDNNTYLCHKNKP